MNETLNDAYAVKPSHGPWPSPRPSVPICITKYILDHPLRASSPAWNTWCVVRVAAGIAILCLAISVPRWLLVLLLGHETAPEANHVHNNLPQLVHAARNAERLLDSQFRLTVQACR